jgi:hypothetical protein
MLQNNGFGKKK